MIVIIAVGQKQPDWVDTAFLDYANRMPSDQKIVLKTVKSEPRTNGKNIQEIKTAEARRIEAVIEKCSFKCVNIALDEKGRKFTTKEFSIFISKLKFEFSNITFLIGSSDGLDEEIKQKCNHQIRISDMTLPHGLARVILAEQIYRAWSINARHPYHRV